MTSGEPIGEWRRRTSRYDGSLVRALDDEELDRLADRIAERLDAIGDEDAGRRRGETGFRAFTDAFGTRSPSKFAGIVLEEGDAILIESAGGGGYGPPLEREPELVLRDLAEGLVTAQAARDLYGFEVALSPRTAAGAGGRDG